MTAHQVGSYVPAVSTTNDTPGPPEYEIRLAGRLAPRWTAWFDGLSITAAEEGTTVLRGPVVDQAALHGLLQKLRDVGIPLISLTQIPTREPTEPPARPTQEES